MARATRNEERRAAMIRDQITARGIADPHILAAFAAIPRERFVAPEHADSAYADCPLPIGSGQTISQPYIVAAMLAHARLAPGESLLEVGAGSGYAAAVASRIAGRVVAIERHPALADEAAARLAALGIANVAIRTGDGTLGCPEEAPFDVILCAAAGRTIPASLAGQLAPGGRLVMPLGEPGGVQRLVRAERGSDGDLKVEELGAVRFVPLVGAEGWPD